MRRRILFVLLIVCLLAAVPLGFYGSQWGWFTRDAERLCRMALAAQSRERERAESLWTKAARLRPDWFVPHYALTGEPLDSYSASSSSTLLDRLEKFRWLKPLVVKLRRRQQQLGEKEWERRNRLREQARQRAYELVPDPSNLWAIWERNPHAAALYDEGYRLWRLQRYGEMADKVEQGLNRRPTYVRGYAMLLQASARVNQWERGLKRLTDVPPEVWTDLFDALSEDDWLIQQMRERRPAEWRMTFTNFYPTGKSWGATLPSAAEAAHLDGAVLAARGGTLWVSMDQDHGQVWRFHRGHWRMYMVLPPLDIFITNDGQAWLLGDGHTNRFPLQVFEDGRFRPLFPWNEFGEYNEVVEWRGEAWIADGHDGLFRRLRGEWLAYQWGGDVVRVPPRKNPDGSRHWTRVLRDSGLPKLDYDSPEWGVLCVDSKGQLWYGQRLFDGTRFVLPNAKRRAWRKRCWVDSAYRLWGPDEGFWGKSKWMLNWKSSSEYHYYHRPPPKLADAKGRVWIGTEGAGLALWDGKRLAFFTTQDGLSGDTVRSLALDGETLWIGTDRGVSRARVPR